MKSALTTALDKAERTLDQLALLKKQKNQEIELQNLLYARKVCLKSEMAALSNKARTAKTTLDHIWLTELERVQIYLGEWGSASARLHMVVSAHLLVFKARKKKKSKSTDVWTKVKNVYEQARIRVVYLRATEVSELREKIEKHVVEVEAKVLWQQTKAGLVRKATELWSQVDMLLEATLEDGTNVAVLVVLQKEVFALKKTVAEALPAVQKSPNLCVDAVKKAHSVELELSSAKHRG